PQPDAHSHLAAGSPVVRLRNLWTPNVAPDFYSCRDTSAWRQKALFPQSCCRWIDHFDPWHFAQDEQYRHIKELR
ncbi:MAG: hypothetical protein ACRELG_00050, partial [Gemmataceae bacterium]